MDFIWFDFWNYFSLRREGQTMKMISFFSALFIITISTNIFPQSIDFFISVEESLKTISPYIYGTNQLLTEEENWTAMRQGGNRLTGYNWENNASNAGTDYLNSSDNFLTWIAGIQNENEPGIVTTTFRDKSIELDAYSLVTLQLAGYVARDKNGTVTEQQTAPSLRWRSVKFEKGSTFSLQPDTSDSFVYLDEYVNLLVNRFGMANTPTGIKGYALDNEPGLWISTHPRIHPVKARCLEMVQKAIDVSTAVKNVDPYLEIFGPVLYGFNAYYNFQDAADWDSVKAGTNYQWFIDYYLDQMRLAEISSGKRLLDVLDIHWYPEARGDNRITETNANSTADKLARVQAPRTLWDDNYTENSWIGQWFSAYLPLIPRLKESIDEFYPGTKLAFTEFSYGGENDITGAIAMADVLGIFGKYDVYLGTYWQLDSPSNYISAAYKIYRNYDGNNSTFANYSLPSVTSDSVSSSVYGSLDDAGNEIHLIAINKKLNESVAGNFSISSQHNIQSGRVWKLDDNSSEISEINSVSNITNNSFSYTLPSGSICHFVLQTDAVNVAEENHLPESYYLAAYPNPFNPSTLIKYSLKNDRRVTIKIFNTLGEELRTLVDEIKSAGNYEVEFRANDLPSGVYIYRMQSGEFVSSKKMILIK
jgi:mannan endo-1,4-beta-mannosidase